MRGIQRLLALGLQHELRSIQFCHVAAGSAVYFHSAAPDVFPVLEYTNSSVKHAQTDKQYVDRLKVTARAGAGGNGCVSFWRSASKGKYTPADGGDGGDGGNVILRASSNVKSLVGVPQLLKAEVGKHGSRQKLHGRRGKDTIILVPTGTVVSKLTDFGENDSSSGSSDGKAVEEESMPEWIKQWRKPWVGAEDYTSADEHDGDLVEDDQLEIEAHPSAQHQETLTTAKRSAALLSKEDYAKGYRVIADLLEDGQEVVVARGGQGGKGNAAMRALPRRPAPSTALPSSPGESARLLLELKLLADVALVGLPNVGKSSLLRVLSAATPRVGPYAFTTLRPQLGTINVDNFGNKLVVADVPGLIQGAHENRGLGYRFLRHVERARAFAFVVDASGGIGTRQSTLSETKISTDLSQLKPWEQLQMVRNEIAEYSSELLSRPWIVVANKIDLLKRPGMTLLALEKKCTAAGAVKVVGVSATGGDASNGEPQGVEELVQALQNLGNIAMNS